MASSVLPRARTGSHAGTRAAALAGAALLVWVMGTATAPRLAAQARGDAGAVMLRLRPHVGDTLHTRLEQQTDVALEQHGDANALSKLGVNIPRSVTTSVIVDSRTVVLTLLPASVLVMTIVDSAELHTSDAHGVAQVKQAEATLRGQQIVLQLAGDGTVESARDVRGGAVSRDLASAMASMPAVFPRRPVRVGEQWTRLLPLPSGGPLGTRGSGHVDAMFRLDSLDRSGSLAFLSVTGDIRADSTSAGVQLSGSMAGAMQIDRVRGWMTDSRLSVVLRSLITPPASMGLQPMRFTTRVTQRLRTMDKR